MEFFETSEKVVVYMNKKRLELLITHLGSTLSLTNSSGSQVSYYAFISKKKTNSNTITTEMSPIRNMNHKRKYQLNRSQ